MCAPHIDEFMIKPHLPLTQYKYLHQNVDVIESIISLKSNYRKCGQKRNTFDVPLLINI